MPRMFLFLIAAAVLFARPALAADLAVEVRNIQPGPGNVVLHLWNSAETFRDEEKAVAMQSVPADAATVLVTFKDLEPGHYALIGYHDEDGNGKMNRFMGMIPTEGYCVSNNPSLAGPPKFDISSFPVGAPHPEETVLEMKY